MDEGIQAKGYEQPQENEKKNFENKSHLELLEGMQSY